MRVAQRETDTLRTLVAMPFLDWLELAAVAGVAETTAHRTLHHLRERGQVDFLRHASEHLAATRRWHATAQGLAVLASADGMTMNALLHRQPVSAHWHRLLLARLDAAAVIYRLAATAAASAGFLRFRWYRALPLDAAFTLSGGRTLGVIRQGRTADRAAFGERVGWLAGTRQPLPRGLLAIFPDDARLNQARSALSRYPGSVYLAREDDVASCRAEDPVWHTPSSRSVLSLEQALTLLPPGGELLHESPLRRVALPANINPPQVGGDTPDHLLAARLNPAHKRMLDCLADWPWITPSDLAGILGISDSRRRRRLHDLTALGLVSGVVLDDERCLALSRRGLALLARRDRASIAIAIRRWSVEPDDGAAPASWREVPGVRARPLARTIEHTRAVHRFMADLVLQASQMPNCRVIRVSPPHHSSRHFPHRGQPRSIHPDGSGVVQAGDQIIPFFLEWERRAVNPSTMAARLAPYLRYFSADRPLDDHGRRPLVLVVFDDFIAESNFLGVARDEMTRAGVNVPLWVSHRELLEDVGPLGKAWRNPDVLEPSRAFW